MDNWTEPTASYTFDELVQMYRRAKYIQEQMVNIARIYDDGTISRKMEMAIAQEYNTVILMQGMFLTRKPETAWPGDLASTIGQQLSDNIDLGVRTLARMSRRARGLPAGGGM